MTTSYIRDQYSKQQALDKYKAALERLYRHKVDLYSALLDNDRDRADQIMGWIHSYEIDIPELPEWPESETEIYARLKKTYTPPRERIPKYLEDRLKKAENEARTRDDFRLAALGGMVNELVPLMGFAADEFERYLKEYERTAERDAQEVIRQAGVLCRWSAGAGPHEREAHLQLWRRDEHYR